MPSYVIKVDPSRDEYVYWSTVVEAPLFSGSRKAMASHLAVVGETDDGKRIDRADLHGTSALWGNPPVYGWACESLIYQQRGTVYRDDLWALARRQAQGEPVDDLIHPFEDEAGDH